MKRVILKLIPIIVVLLLINAIVYLFTAFITWQSNPMFWDTFTRFMVVLFGAGISLVAIAAYIEYLNE